MTKTDQDIEREKEAVAKMVGAKGAMTAMLERHDRLEGTLKAIADIADDLGKRVGEDLMIKTFYHGEKDAGQQTVSIRSQLLRISSAVAKVT